MHTSFPAQVQALALLHWRLFGVDSESTTPLTLQLLFWLQPTRREHENRPVLRLQEGQVDTNQ
jgi:hypothetical protein